MPYKAKVPRIRFFFSVLQMLMMEKKNFLYFFFLNLKVLKFEYRSQSNIRIGWIDIVMCLWNDSILRIYLHIF